MTERLNCTELNVLKMMKRVAPNKSKQVFVKPVIRSVHLFFPSPVKISLDHGCIVHSGRSRVTPRDSLLPAGGRDPSSKPSM